VALKALKFPNHTFTSCVRLSQFTAIVSIDSINWLLFAACHTLNIYTKLKWICVINGLRETAVHNTLEDRKQSQARLSDVSIIKCKTLVCPAIRDPGTIILQYFTCTSVCDIYLFMRYELYVICFVVPSHAKLHMYITASNQYNYVTC